MPVVTINNVADIIKVETELILSINQIPLSKVSIRIKTTSGLASIIYWGDGTVTNTNNDELYVHTYSKTSTSLKLQSLGGLADIIEIRFFTFNITDNISKFSILPNLKVLNLYSESAMGNLKDLPISIKEFITKSPIRGSVTTFPSNLEILQILHYLADVTGSVNLLPSNLKYIELYKSNLGGTINNLPSSIVTIKLTNNYGNITGNLNNLPITVKELTINGIEETIFGDLATLPNNIEIISIMGKNTILGSINNLPHKLKSVIIRGFNTITGNISTFPFTLETLDIGGYNTIGGSINNLTKFTFYLAIQGNNTISGDIATNKISRLYIEGNNTIGGNLAGMAINGNTQTVSIRGTNNTIHYSNSKNYTGQKIFQLGLRPISSTFLDTQVDQMLIDLANTSNLKALITLEGPYAKRTSASDAAVNTIISKGGTVKFVN